MSALLTVAAAMAFATSTESGRTRFLSPPAWVFLGLAGFSVLQAVPLPVGLLEQLGPANADVWRRSLAPLGEPSTKWASLSLDPGASVVEGLKWASYAAVFGCSTVLAAQRGATWGVSLVFASGVAAAVTTVLHGLSGAAKVYSIYQPHFPAAAWHVGPLLNPNNLGGYLNLAALCGMGLMMSAKSPAPRWLMALGVAVIVAVGVTSGSRGGFLVLLLGILVLASTLAVARWRRGAKFRRSKVPWIVLAAVAGGALLALLGGNASVWQELRDKNLTKLLMVNWVRPMLQEHPWFGIGRGAFESVFPAYRTEPGNIIYAHAENFPAQWTTEWGLVVGLAAIAAFAWLFRPGRLGVGRSALTAGGWVGVFILALHNLFDLALEVPSVMFAAATVLGSLWGAAARPGPDERASAQVLPRAEVSGPFAATALGLLLIALAARFGANDVSGDRRFIHARYNDGSGAKDPEQRVALKRELRAAMLRHPAEPYFPLIRALVAVTAKDENPLPWLARAIERGQTNGRAHLLLAEALAERGHRGQALMELRFAAGYEPALAFAVAKHALRWSNSPDDVRSAVPEGAAGAPVLEAMAALRPQDAEARRRFLGEALARDHQSPSANAAMATEILAELALGGGSTMCAAERRAECIRAVRSHARVLDERDQQRSAGPRLEARLLRLEGSPRAAERLLADRCRSTGERAECLRARVEAAAECTPPTELQPAIKDYLAASCATTVECADAATFVADLEASRGNWGSAMSHYGRAAQEAPTEQRWLKLADAASRLGAHAQAVEALEKVAKLRGQIDPALRERIEAERAALLGSVKKNPRAGDMPEH